MIPNEDQSRTINNDSEFDVWSEMVMWKLNFGVCRQLDLNGQTRKVKIENYGDWIDTVIFFGNGALIC